MRTMTLEVGHIHSSYLYRCNLCGDQIVVLWNPDIMGDISAHATCPCERVGCKGKMERTNEITVGRARVMCE